MMANSVEEKIDLENAEQVKASKMSSAVKKAIRTKKKLKLVQAEKKIDLDEEEEVKASEMPSFVKFSAPRLVRDAKGEKKVEYFPAGGWKDKTKEEYAKMFNPSHKVICVVTGKINNITVFDFDTEQAYYDCIEKYPQLKKAYTVKTNKGFHIYCKYNPLQKTGVNQEKKIDVRNDGALAFGNMTKTEYGVTYKMIDNEKKIDIEMPQEFYDWVFPPSPPPPPKKKVEKKVRENEDAKKMYLKKQIVNIINTEVLDKMDDFRRIVWAMKNEGFTIEDVKKIAQKSNHYDEETYDEWFSSTKLWDSKTKKNACKMGTLIHYAKVSDTSKYLELYLQSKTGDLDTTDIGLAQIYLDILGDNLFYQEKKIYLYDTDENEWKRDGEGAFTKKNFREEMEKFYNKLIEEKDKQLNEIEGEEGKEGEIGELLKNIEDIKDAKKKIKSVTTLNNVLSAIKILMATLKKEIIFDTGDEQNYNIHFKNGVYELNTNTFRPRTKDDYVSLILSWDYEPEIVTEEARDEIWESIRRIVPDEEKRTCLLSYLHYCLTGDTSAQKYMNLVGYSGGNGKSHIIKMMGECFEFYTKKLSQGLFNVGNAKRHKEMIHLYEIPVRFAYLEEMDKDKKQDAEYLKDVVDGDKIPVEIMYGTTADVNLHAKITTSSNSNPNINFELPIMRRMIILLLEAKFAEVGERDKAGNLWLPDGVDIPEQNRYLKQEGKEKMFKCPIMKNAVFELLTRPEYKILYVPDSVKHHTTQVAEQGDTFMDRFAENFDLTGNDEDVVNKQVFMEIMNLQTNDLLKTISELKTVVQYKKDKKKDKVKGCFIGLKIKEEEKECLVPLP